MLFSPWRRPLSRCALTLVVCSLCSAAGAYATPPAAPPPADSHRVATTSDGVPLHALLAYAAIHAPLMALDGANDARVRAARAAAGPVLVDNPQLDIGGGFREQGGAFGPDFEVGLSQRFEVAGERRARLRVADAAVAGIDAATHQRHWTLHTTIHALFYRAVVARERVALARRVVDFQREIAIFVGKQRAAGAASELDERVATAEMVNVAQELSALVQTELSMRQALARVTGWPVETPPLPVAALGPAHPLAPLPELIATARDRHPQFAVLDAEIALRQAEVKAAERDAAPEPTFGLRWSHEASPGLGSGPPSNIIFATASVPIPLFSKNQAAIAEARAALVIAETERRRLDAEIAADVTRAAGAANAAEARLVAFGEDVLPRFEDNLAALRRAYTLGQIDIVALASGRERFLDVQRAALAAQDDYFMALAELESAVGTDIIDVHGQHDGRGENAK